MIMERTDQVVANLAFDGLSESLGLTSIAACQAGQGMSGTEWGGPVTIQIFTRRRHPACEQAAFIPRGAFLKTSN